MKVGQVVEEIETCKILSHKIFELEKPLTNKDRELISLMLNRHVKTLEDMEVKSDND